MQQQLNCFNYTADTRECLEAANLEPNCSSTATDNRYDLLCPAHILTNCGTFFRDCAWLLVTAPDLCKQPSHISLFLSLKISEFTSKNWKAHLAEQNCSRWHQHDAGRKLR